MFDFFKKQAVPPPNLEVDIHSHLIPGVDDGVQSFQKSIDLIQKFVEIGHKKIITTPHIMSDFYKNSESDLMKIYQELVVKLKEEKVEVTLELGAEYYLDEYLLERIENPEEKFLTFGKNYMLFETSFMNEPFYLKDFIFKAKSRGINPILAHPERYSYLIGNDELIEDLVNRELLLQLNINSLAGYYSKQVKSLAEKLIDKKLISFIGSDCHNLKHFEVLQTARSTKYYHKVMALPLKNYEL
ncbi:MAG TPA: capsular biosynthesis protein [Fulvivirga sp.]|nr:capsular biosynthesis protein [Fulvivirga sp.]